MAVNNELLDGMVIFVELMQSGSFTKAAENMDHSTSNTRYQSKCFIQSSARTLRQGTV